MTNHWAEAHGGLRGSTFLTLAAAAYLAAAVLHVAARLQNPNTPGPSDPLFMVALMAWDATLFLLGTGFLWTGINPVLGRFGIGLGIFIYLQAGYLLFSLVTGNPLPIPPSALTAGRTFLLAAFAVVEGRALGRGTALLLGLTAGAQFGQVMLRGLANWPRLEQPAETVLGAMFMASSAVAMLAVGRAVRRQENAWALDHGPHSAARFSDFNNPQHEWNRR